MPTVPGRKAAALTAGVSSDNSALLARAINSFWSHSKKTHQELQTPSQRCIRSEGGWSARFIETNGAKFCFFFMAL